MLNFTAFLIYKGNVMLCMLFYSICYITIINYNINNKCVCACVRACVSNYTRCSLLDMSFLTLTNAVCIVLSCFFINYLR